MIVGRAVHRTRVAIAEKDEANCKLQKALDEVGELQDIVPICTYCKSVRNDKRYNDKVEGYIRRIAGQKRSHGLCPGCLRKMNEAHGGRS